MMLSQAMQSGKKLLEAPGETEIFLQVSIKINILIY